VWWFEHQPVQRTLRSMKAWSDEGVGVDICRCGCQGDGFFNSCWWQCGASCATSARATVSQLIGGVKTMLDAYADGDIDKLFLVSNEFVNTMTQKPRCGPAIAT
jgi:F-type H+-transporting ATPase subunit gamma